MFEPHSRQEFSTELGQKKVSGQLNKVIQKLFSDNLIEHTIPDMPNHPARNSDSQNRVTGSWNYWYANKIESIFNLNDQNYGVPFM